MATKQKQKDDPKAGKRREYLGLLVLAIIAAVLITIGYLQIQNATPKSVNLSQEEVITVDNRTVISEPSPSEPAPSAEGCPLYSADTPQTFNFQLLHKDKSDNSKLPYELRYSCTCAECTAGCGMNYTDLVGGVSIPIIRFSDADLMTLYVNGERRDSFPLKCTQSQTVIYLTDEECKFSYDCYFFDDLVAEKLTYQALNSYTCDSIARNCDEITLKE